MGRQPRAGTISGASFAATLRGNVYRTEPWPTIGERVTLATLAWLPLALLIGYGGAALSGCDRAAASCSPQAEPIQLGLMAVVLAVVALVPRAAYVGAWAAVVVAITGIVLAVPAAILGNYAPIPGPLVAVGLAILAAAYVGGAALAARDRPMPRPWTLPARSRPPKAPH